jgi:mycothiol synthase
VHGLSGAGRPEVELVVAPSARRRGVGAALADAVLDAVGGIPLTAWSHGNHPGAAALAARTRFENVRSLWLMRRPGAAALPAASAPPGVTIRAFRPGEDDEGFLAVNAVAFASHPEQGDLDAAGLAERMEEEWFDPAGFLVAEQDGRIVGVHWTKVEERTGEVYVIGVGPSAQGGGLGKALLVAGLSHLAERGVDEVELYVEGDNTAAIGLYESYGFSHADVDTDVMYAGPR